jgi:hypothetical protein
MLLALALGAATAVVVGDTTTPQVLLIIVPLGLLLAFVVFANPGLAAIGIGLALPWVEDVTGGHVGLNIATSDVLMVLLGARILAAGVLRHRLPALSALRPVGLVLLQYAWMIALLLVFHFSFSTSVKSFQRLELYALPALVGAYLALSGYHMRLLKGYVLGCAVLSVAWPLHVLVGALDKNPTGGFIAGAVILLVAVRELRSYRWFLPILIVGLLSTASRGAVLALGVGLVVYLVMQAASGRNTRAVAVQVLSVIVIGTVVYLFLPNQIAQRLTNYTASTRTRGSYALLIRVAYAQDAERIIAAHPLVGVGVGQYRAGSAQLGTGTTDPHDVILLEAAEGGYAFAVSFVVLLGGLAYTMWRFRRIELAVAAAAVLLGTFAHGLVDVYWVRGTPVLGFLLVGMVCGLYAQRRRGLSA